MLFIDHTWPCKHCNGDFNDLISRAESEHAKTNSATQAFWLQYLEYTARDSIMADQGLDSVVHRSWEGCQG